MTSRSTQQFDRSLESMEYLFSFIEGFLGPQNVSGEIRSLLIFVAEELFTNMVKYNPGGPSRVTAAISIENGKIILQMEDHQDKPFDPTAREEVDINLPLSERGPGGLGIHLIIKMMDELTYSFDNGISRTTAVKYLEKKNV